MIIHCALTLPSLGRAAWQRPALWSEPHTDAELLQALAVKCEVSADRRAAAGRAPGTPKATNTHSRHISIQSEDLHHNTFHLVFSY